MRQTKDHDIQKHEGIKDWMNELVPIRVFVESNTQTSV